MPFTSQKPRILRKQAFNLISSACHPHHGWWRSPSVYMWWQWGDVGWMGVYKPPPPAPKCSLVTVCRGGGQGDQMLTGRCCKPQTNYTPSPNTAGHLRKKTSSSIEGALQETMETLRMVKFGRLFSSSLRVEV